ncbi:MAG: protein-(glutamine-N5) methyltransferase, release factor-specific [Anaerolineaceae bacterium]|nr:protein-(glutamine-N5) methyltransferase, release factor-specific [Anaerolineaceae bacterium]
MPTLRDALTDARARLAHLPTPRLDAEWLLCHMLDVPQSYLIAHSTDLLPDDQRAQYDALVIRRASGEPLAYILGEVGFYGRTFTVSPAVLIPRPETEHLIEAGLSALNHWTQPIIADIGTGSGAIAVTLAAECLQATVYATDISPDALAIARQNASHHQVDVTFFEGDLAAPLLPELSDKVNLLAANLPYIARDEVPTLDVSQHEPTLALDGGSDGLDLVRRLLGQVPQLCTDDATILLEIGADQGQATADIARSLLGEVSIRIEKDYADLDRLVVIGL